MITTIFAIAALTLQQSRPKPSALVTQMLAKYNGVTTLTGKLRYEQSAKDTDGKEYSSHGDTTLQIEKPGKLFIYQTSDAASSAPGRIVSDGARFLYDIPQDTRDLARTIGTVGQQNSELVENVVQFDYNTQANITVGLGDMYNIGRGGLPLNPDAPLDIAISREADLRAFVDQLATVNDQGDAQINGQTAHLVGGDWRQYADAPVSGSYQLAITDGGDLLRYVLKESVSDAGLGANGAVVRAPTIGITTTWDVDLKVNGQVDESLFKDQALAPPPQQAAPSNPPAVSPPTGGGKPPR